MMYRVLFKKLNSISNKTYRLPTEAEWEYAARAGTNYTYAGSNDIDAVAWYGYEKSEKKTHPVGTKKANDWGIYDMSGNVWEWCEDWYGEDYYTSSPSSNPKGPNTGQYRVLRGGSWSSRRILLPRVLSQRAYDPSDRSTTLSAFASPGSVRRGP